MRRTSSILISFSLLFSASASAQTVLLYLPLDTAGESNSVIVTKDGEAAPSFVAGKYGQGLHFQTISALAVPYKFDFATYPQTTVTAWVKQDVGGSNTRSILSSASTGGLMLYVSGGRVGLVPGTGGLTHPTPMPYDEWVFVAGVVDMNAHRAAVYMNDSEPAVQEGIATITTSAAKFSNPDDPDAPKEPYLVVGAAKFYPWLAATRALAIDDVRLYEAALTRDEIDAIRLGGAPVQTAAIGETEKNEPDGDAGAVSAQTKPYDTDSPTGSATSDPVDVAENSTSPREVGQVFESAPADGQVEAGTPPISAQGGATEIGDAGDQIAESADQALPDAPPPPITAPTEKVNIPDARETIKRSQEDALPEGAPPPETNDGSITQQQGLTPGESSGEPYGMGDITQVKYSAIAGFEGANKRRLDLGEKFLRKIGWTDRNDVPCAIGVASDMQSALDVAHVEEELGCPGTLTLQSPALIFDYVAGLPTSVINSIEVCSGFTGSPLITSRRLKGVRVTGDNVGADGSITYAQEADEEHLRRCSSWSGPKLCPNEHVGTGLVVHSDSRRGDNKEQIVGLQLICRKVGVR